MLLQYKSDQTNKYTLWLELSKDADPGASVVAVDETVRLADETGSDDNNAQDTEKSLQVTGESISEDDLKEFVEQIYRDDEISISENEEQGEISMDFLKKN